MFTPFRTLPYVLATSSSTRFPSLTRLALPILVLTLLLTTTHFFVLLVLGTRLLRLGSTTTCRIYTELMDQTLDDYTTATLPFPLILINNDFRAISDRRLQVFELTSTNASGVIVMVAIVTPLCSLAWVAWLVYEHLRRKGVSNRRAVGEGLGILVLLVLLTLQDAYLGPDRRHVHDPEGEHNWCWKMGDEYARMEREWWGRRALGLAGECVVGGACVCMVLYILLAIRAAVLNKRYEQSQAIRMNNLQADGSSGSTPSALLASNVERHTMPEARLPFSRPPPASTPTPVPAVTKPDDRTRRLSSEAHRESRNTSNPFDDSAAIDHDEDKAKRKD